MLGMSRHTMKAGSSVRPPRRDAGLGGGGPFGNGPYQRDGGGIGLLVPL